MAIKQIFHVDVDPDGDSVTFHLQDYQRSGGKITRVTVPYEVAVDFEVLVAAIEDSMFSRGEVDRAALHRSWEAHLGQIETDIEQGHSGEPLGHDEEE